MSETRTAVPDFDATTLPSDDEYLGRWLGTLQAERHAYWLSGDAALLWIHAIEHAREQGKFTRRQAQREIRRALGVLAKAAGQGMTMGTVHQRARVCDTFPDHARPLPDAHGRTARYLDLPPTYYRAVYHAALRLKQDAIELLDDCLAKGLTVSDIGQLGKEVGTAVAVTGKCDACGARIAVKIEGQCAARAEVHGLVIPCGVCVALKRKAGTDGADAGTIGALEAA